MLHVLLVDELGKVCRTRGGKRNAYRDLFGKSEAKRPLLRWGIILKFTAESWNKILWIGFT
jgi:hypothetical protein